MTIKIYSTPTCPWCVLAKQYFAKKNIAFEDIDVSANQAKAQEMVEVSGQMGVPVITIDDQIIIGFDQEKIEQALNG